MPLFSGVRGRCVLGSYTRSVQDLRSNDKPHFLAGWRIMPLYTQLQEVSVGPPFPAGQEEGSTPMVCVDRDRDIPLPIVQLNRWVLVVGVVGGLILRQPLLTTALFLVVLSAVLFGR